MAGQMIFPGFVAGLKFADCPEFEDWLEFSDEPEFVD
jgi:hypothetical protein